MVKKKKLDHGWGRSIGSFTRKFHYYETKISKRSLCRMIIVLNISDFTFFEESKIKNQRFKCKKCISIIELRDTMKKLLSNL